MHARLHLGANIIRRLALSSLDAPDILRHCPKLSCVACSEANAHRISLSHSHGHEAPRKVRTLRPGQLHHADIAGPFTASIGGGYRYALILVDDFTRYKWVYFMRQKSDAPSYVRGFVASFQALLAKRQGADATWTVDAFHMDNAGEFLSREFKELLDEGGISQTTCPPHVHELNGVAERAIRTIFSNVRSNMATSGAKSGYWTHLVRHSRPKGMIPKLRGPRPRICLNRFRMRSHEQLGAARGRPPRRCSLSFRVLTGARMD